MIFDDGDSSHFQPSDPASPLQTNCACMVPAEACCKHLVMMARDEVASNPNVSQAMRDFSNILESDAEVGARRILMKHGLTLPVTISHVDLGESKELKKFPWVKLSSWFQYLLEKKMLWRQFVGVDTVNKMKSVLSEFWRRYRALDSDHPVFKREQEGLLRLDCLVPYYTHSDESRTFRDAPLWVFNVHGMVGRGTLEYLRLNKHRLEVHSNSQGLNYVGNTWATHLLIATMMKHVSSPETISKLISEFASDAKSLLDTGLTDGVDRFWFVHVATKGDLPALAKLARFTRSFGNVPKASSSKKACRGVCWKCLGGQERDVAHGKVAIPFEDFSKQPAWEPTIFQELPWVEPPSILQGLDLDDHRAINFFQSDFFHNVHLGVLKSFASSTLVSIIEANLPCFDGCGSVESKFQRLSEIYKTFWIDRKRKPWISEISRDLVCWPVASACPSAKWNKGQASTQMMQFLQWFAEKFLSQSTDPVMNSIVLRLH